MSTTTPVLFPEVERSYNVHVVPLASIVKGAVPEIKPQFIECIRRFGILEPVWLKEESDGSYTIAAGRRRIAVANLLGIGTVRAFILPALYSSAAIALMENHHRSHNPFSDFEAIEEILQSEGMTYETIAETLGIPIGTIRRILRLQKLIVPLYNLARTGKVPVSFAFLASTLSHAEQERLSEIYSDTGKLKADDIRDLKRARKLRSKTALAALVESSDKRAADGANFIRSAITLYEDAGLHEKAEALRTILYSG